ncbi:MAG: SCP2 sterol-binding domain-containing protein [Candidatus Lokiarchaeota archaeon]|nr:SCP2 sterol-binding domain-containing protein [Candidatus Lokiarchaeota archaeon]
MSDPRTTAVWPVGSAKAVAAVVYSGVAMQFVGVAMLAIPNLTFDASNPLVMFPAYSIALVIIGIGVGITLIGARAALNINKRGGVARGTPVGQMAAFPGPNVIRPPLVKKGTSEPATGPVAAGGPVAKAARPVTPTATENRITASSGPADMESVKAALNAIIERYDKPDVRDKFDGWVKNLVMSFPDIDKSYVYRINGSEGIDMTEGSDDSAAVQVTMASDMFVKLLSKQINAIKAYSSGALKVKGEMKNLLKLRKLMF